MSFPFILFSWNHLILKNCVYIYWSKVFYTWTKDVYENRVFSFKRFQFHTLEIFNYASLCLCLYFRLDILIITSLRLDGATRWQASMFEGLMLTSNSSKMFSVVSSKELSLTVSGMPNISRHSHLEYRSLLQYFRSSWTL